MNECYTVSMTTLYNRWHAKADEDSTSNEFYPSYRRDLVFVGGPNVVCLSPVLKYGYHLNPINPTGNSPFVYARGYVLSDSFEWVELEMSM